MITSRTFPEKSKMVHESPRDENISEAIERGSSRSEPNYQQNPADEIREECEKE